ncbi:uncharacterized protein [Coffea arabica]|uniref:Uncharacterized protein n=1 Tax=Coffea arabica TaxID=13443 RepID=A0A6P6U5R8_COFAR|nr:uncharacterized protein LOC113707392 [Coffea arabica]
MATFGRQKGVWVAVYVERPRSRRRLLSNSRQPQHHHHHHQHLHLHQDCNTRGYNRKAQLLEYSRQLRESARSQASSPLLHPKPVANHNHHRQPMTQMIAVQKMRRHAVTPTCMGNWKLLVPGFFRSLLMPHNKKPKNKRKRTNNRSTATKIKAIMKSFQVNRRKGFTSKMFATLRKRR